MTALDPATLAMILEVFRGLPWEQVTPDTVWEPDTRWLIAHRSDVIIADAVPVWDDESHEESVELLDEKDYSVLPDMCDGCWIRVKL